MITNDQLDAAYHQMIADTETEIDDNDKTLQAIEDLGWDYNRFNQSMYQSYPDTYCSRLWVVPQPLFDIPKRGTK